MSSNDARTRAFRESLAPYGSSQPSVGVVKLSISLPADLLAIVRAAASESGTTVSATIAAAIRQTLSSAEQAQIDAGLEAQNDENAAFALAYAPVAAELLAKLEW